MAMTVSMNLEERLNELPASEVARRIAAGETTSEAVVRACLDRIAAREPDVRAFATLDPELVLAEAKRRDREPPRGPLHGVPFGVKDVIDTADLPTGMGSKLYDGYRPRVDAACVALARAAGGIVLGKTTTAEFAGSAPTVTRNPLALGHTPGGSSSGSAAAVADDMLPVAFGTQTGGSVLRPASFCGVIGFKPTFGTFNPVGVKPAAESFDTVGLIARTLDDIELFTAVLVNDAPRFTPRPESAPRIGLCRTHLWDTAQPETVAAVENAASALARAGAPVVEIGFPDSFSRLSVERAVINAYERAHSLAHEWHHGRDAFSPQMLATCEKGLGIRRAEYVQALRFAAECRRAVGALFENVDVLLAPCVPGEAPEGLEYAGDPRFQEIWTMLHVPTLTLPAHRGPRGLPVGIQLVGPHYEEGRLFAAARWVEARLAAS
ncbi:amidase [Starkeya sp. ORNL1]|uniref:amidase n=1 Tax=Starkeya sp. ORNL1 TaxID=2709380 RepID=UPI00197E65EA|nr:amidase [Starkeya sp. ORNL1]